MEQVVPMDQSFEDYAGIFHFRFWWFGKWVDVVIDDNLPTKNKQLLFASSKCGNEFWAPLLEKAYAKLCGSYANMRGWSSSDAFKDFTGGVNQIYYPTEPNAPSCDELWLTLSRATKCKSLICCSTSCKEDAMANTGLVMGHAYSVTGITEVELNASKVRLVRVMNPWGRREWNGKWSDKSDLWDKVSPEVKKKCFDRDDGEFWMQMEDFCSCFAKVYICCQTPNFLDGDLKCQWNCMIYDGSWVAGTSAGGNVKHCPVKEGKMKKMTIFLRFEKSIRDKDNEKATDEDPNYALFKLYADQNLFHRSDVNENGSLSDDELQKAIKAAGMDVNDASVGLMMSRYSGFSTTSLEEFTTLMLRLDKMSGGATLMTDKELMKRGRGAFDYRSAEGVIAVKWFDNKCVNLLSNASAIMPLSTVKRWSKESKAKVMIPCPSLIPAYNEHMGGIDLSDMLVHLYKTPAKSTRWYLPLFGYMLDLSIANSWLVYKRERGQLNQKPITLKRFRLAVAHSLKQVNKPASSSPPPPKKRYTPRPSHPQPDYGIKTDQEEQ
nr:PREDICTED: uncharacterized protein LOC102193255 [Pundamilia nyererei]